MALPPTLQRPKGMAAVIACLTLFALTQGLSYPLLALRLKAAGYDEAAIGLSGSATAIGVLLASLFLTGAIRRWGAQKVVLWCAGWGVCIWLLFPLLDSFWVWFSLRLLQGAAATGAYLVGEIWLNQVVEPAKRARSIALYSSILSVGFGTGPLILTLVGTTGYAAFLVGAGGCLLTVAAVLFFAGDLPQRPPPAPEGKGKTWQLCLSIWPLLVIIALISFFDQAVLSLVPVFGIAKGMTEAAAALMVTTMVVGHISLQVFFGHLADRMGPVKVVMYCGFAAGLLSLLLAYLIGSSWLSWPALFLWGATGFSIYMLGLAELGRRFSDDRLVIACAAFGFCWGVGGLMGPVATGWFMTQVGGEGLFWVLAVSLGAIGVLGLLERRRKAA